MRQLLNPLLSNLLKSSYHPTGDYISFDFVYQPEVLIDEVRSGSYGEAIDYQLIATGDTAESAKLYSYAARFDCQATVGGVLIYGTPAGIDQLLLAIELLHNYGFWDDVMTQTRTVVAQPFTNAGGCGECPGSVIWVSPEYDKLTLTNTIYHEYLHNCGWTAEEQEHAWIFQQAGKVQAYLSG